MKARHLVLAFALTNAILYACVLPLWEGFDEPMHYGYVESLSIRHGFPVYGKTRLPADIQRSLTLVPISWLLNTGMGHCCTSFEDWFALPMAERMRREHELASLPPGLKIEASDIVNWEAQQAPLAYLILAPLDVLAQRLPLRPRILMLRLLGAISATLLIYLCLVSLLGRLAVTAGLQFVVLACVFESQMLWASIAHVSNDWLAIALTSCFLTVLATVAREGDARRLLLLAVVFSLGMLTKAYFLAFAPIFLAVVAYDWARAFIHWKTILTALAIPVAIDGPWYVHNVLLYRSITGTQQSMAGIGIAQVIAAIPRIDWMASALNFVRWSLWTGNWSFVSFSRTTLDIEALLLCASLVLYFIHYRRIGKRELWVLAACGCFVAGLVYQTCATWIHTRGVSTSPEPWYAQGLMPCLWAFCFAGLAVSGMAGRIIGILLCLVSAWIAELTYVAKLLPLYGGGPYSRSTLRALSQWWLSNPAENLRGVVMAPVGLIYLLLVAFSVLLVVVTAISVRNLMKV